MDVIEALRSRHCTRAFTQKPVEKELLLDVLKAAGQSPSYANSQPWEIYAAAGTSMDRLRAGVLEKFRAGAPISPDIPMVKLWPEPYKTYIEEMGMAHLKHLGVARDDKAKRTENIERNLSCFGAPAVIYLCLHTELSNWSFYDLGLYSQSVMLAAQHYGLNTIPAVMTAAYPEPIREELNIPDHLNIVLGIAIGYAEESSPHNQFRTARKPLDVYVRIKEK